MFKFDEGKLYHQLCFYRYLFDLERAQKNMSDPREKGIARFLPHSIPSLPSLLSPFVVLRCSSLLRVNTFCEKKLSLKHNSTEKLGLKFSTLKPIPAQFQLYCVIISEQIQNHKLISYSTFLRRNRASSVEADVHRILFPLETRRQNP